VCVCFIYMYCQFILIMYINKIMVNKCWCECLLCICLALYQLKLGLLRVHEISGNTGTNLRFEDPDPPCNTCLFGYSSSNCFPNRLLIHSPLSKQIVNISLKIIAWTPVKMCLHHLKILFVFSFSSLNFEQTNTNKSLISNR